MTRIYKFAVIALLSASLSGAGLLAAPASAKCGRSGGVYIFSAYWCPYCRKAERFMRSRGVDFKRIETAKDKRVRNYMAEQFGTTSVPVIVVDDHVMIGYDRTALKRALCLR